MNINNEPMNTWMTEQSTESFMQNTEYSVGLLFNVFCGIYNLHIRNHVCGVPFWYRFATIEQLLTYYQHNDAFARYFELLRATC